MLEEPQEVMQLVLGIKPKTTLTVQVSLLQMRRQSLSEHFVESVHACLEPIRGE